MLAINTGLLLDHKNQKKIFDWIMTCEKQLKRLVITYAWYKVLPWIKYEAVIGVNWTASCCP